jgi:hypothetical protein
VPILACNFARIVAVIFALYLAQLGRVHEASDPLQRRKKYRRENVIFGNVNKELSRGFNDL